MPLWGWAAFAAVPFVVLAFLLVLNWYTRRNPPRLDRTDWLGGFFDVVTGFFSSLIFGRWGGDHL